MMWKIMLGTTLAIVGYLVLERSGLRVLPVLVALGCMVYGGYTVVWNILTRERKLW